MTLRYPGLLSSLPLTPFNQPMRARRIIRNPSPTMSRKLRKTGSTGGRSSLGKAVSPLPGAEIAAGRDQHGAHQAEGGGHAERRSEKRHLVLAQQVICGHSHHEERG